MVAEATKAKDLVNGERVKGVTMLAWSRGGSWWNWWQMLQVRMESFEWVLGQWRLRGVEKFVGVERGLGVG